MVFGCKMQSKFDKIGAYYFFLKVHQGSATKYMNSSIGANCWAISKHLYNLHVSTHLKFKISFIFASLLLVEMHF